MIGSQFSQIWSEINIQPIGCEGVCDHECVLQNRHVDIAVHEQNNADYGCPLNLRYDTNEQDSKTNTVLLQLQLVYVKLR